MTSKAAALRFFAHNVGRAIDTRQTRPGGQAWEPGPRTLARKGLVTFSLDGSTIQLTSTHQVTAVSDTAVTMEWRDGDGQLIHTTTYTLAVIGTYAWVIDSTKMSHPDDETSVLEETDPELSNNGTTGPHDAPDELLARLANGEGRVWRTLYDEDFAGHPEDGRVCHEGRYLDFADLKDDPRGESVDCDAEFGPLTDFSQPDSGALDIQYRQEDGTWKTL